MNKATIWITKSLRCDPLETMVDTVIQAVAKRVVDELNAKLPADWAIKYQLYNNESDIEMQIDIGLSEVVDFLDIMYKWGFAPVWTIDVKTKSAAEKLWQMFQPKLWERMPTVEVVEEVL